MPHDARPNDSPADLASLAERLVAERPSPSRTLRRRVRDVVSVAVLERAMRRRSMAMFATGTALLVAAIVLTVVAGP